MTPYPQSVPSTFWLRFAPQTAAFFRLSAVFSCRETLSFLVSSVRCSGDAVWKRRPPLEQGRSPALPISSATRAGNHRQRHGNAPVQTVYADVRRCGSQTAAQKHPNFAHRGGKALRHAPTAFDGFRIVMIASDRAGAGFKPCYRLLFQWRSNSGHIRAASTKPTETDLSARSRSSVFFRASTVIFRRCRLKRARH